MTSPSDNKDEVRRKVFIKGRGAFGRAYRGLWDAETGKCIFESYTVYASEERLRQIAEERGWQLVDNPKKKKPRSE